jgi:DNA-binding transcriptional LysR family regulator
MNLTHVLAFHKVAIAGSFTAAAALSGVSQPTLSTQVRSLERTIGHALFERVGRRIRLTPAGQQLLEATRRLAASMDDVEAVIAGARSEARGALRISADSAIHALPILARLKQQSSALRFSIRIFNSAEVISQVQADLTDVGITARLTNDPRLYSTRIRDDRLVLMAAAGDPVAKRRTTRLDVLQNRDLIVREKGSITREVADRALAAAGIRLGNMLEVATREAVSEAVAAGFGYGIVFASEAGSDSRLDIVAIADADVSVSEYAICRADRKGLGLVARFFEAASALAVDNGWLNPTRDKR